VEGRLVGAQRALVKGLLRARSSAQGRSENPLRGSRKGRLAGPASERTWRKHTHSVVCAGGRAAGPVVRERAGPHGAGGLSCDGARRKRRSGKDQGREESASVAGNLATAVQRQCWGRRGGAVAPPGTSEIGLLERNCARCGGAVAHADSVSATAAGGVNEGWQLHEMRRQSRLLGT